MDLTDEGAIPLYMPRLVPELEILPWRRGNIVAPQVYPSGSRPHYLKSYGAENIERGLIKEIGSSPMDPRRRYYLAG